MALKQKTFYSLNDLSLHLKTHAPSFYYSSKTSTVIPYDKLEGLLNIDKENDFYLCDLSKLPGEMRLNNDGHLLIRGAVSWEDAKKFLNAHGRNLKTSPTEQLALITAGVATSCTGERCFGFGTMRSQVVSLKYLNYDGEEIKLHRDDLFEASPSLKSYQDDYAFYRDFKNAPFPRFEKSTDLLIGTEGQMGVITEVEIETAINVDVNYLFMVLPRWEENYLPHLEVFKAVQNRRNDIFSCELLDANCMNYLSEDERLGNQQDIIFLEIKSESFEDIFENVLCQLALTPPENIFEMTEHKFHLIRAKVPRAIFERNSQMGVVKVGTDVQVSPERFEDLLQFYRKASGLGVSYCLFGHFGDAHLHYNYMPSKEETQACLKVFEELYDCVLEWKGSPFAEHGIGLIKQKYIQKFHGAHQKSFFKQLKSIHDPYNQFFPQGFMNLRP